jgi:AcrR family transcriptional regulator
MPARSDGLTHRSSSSSPSVPQELGLRARSKEKTRSAIITQSLKLFAARGYEVVTTQEIADAVGITQRTFFRYFDRKDSIIYASEYNYVARFEASLDLAVTSVDEPYAAIRAAFEDLAAHISDNRQVFSKIYAIIQVSDQLKTLERMHQNRIEWLVACALDGREVYRGRESRPNLKPSLQSRISASVLFGAIRPTLRAWLTSELKGDLGSYAHVVWGAVRPVFDAAQTYAFTVSSTLHTMSPPILSKD